MKFPADVLEALDMPSEDRTTMQRQLTFWSARQMGVKENDIPKHLDDIAKSRREELSLLMADAKLRRPRPDREVSVMAVAELSPTPPPAYRMENGSYDKPREVVAPHFPSILRREATPNPPAIAPPNERTSGRRSALARWLASGENPLTHRVWVNRIWQGHFGRGLVSNANDFGTQTPEPTHPELFEWLTGDFIASGFHSKRLHRQIVTSATFDRVRRVRPTIRRRTRPHPRVSSAPDYSHFPRQRLSSERIRDAWLTASGQLHDAMYGPGTRPELSPNFCSADLGGQHATQQVRRSVYIFAKRNLPYPLMAAFDFPDMHEACGCRTQTTIAPQALMLLNNRLILQAARQLAKRSRDEATSADPAVQIRLTWQIAFGRPASDGEVASSLAFLANQQRLIATSESTSPVEPKALSNAEDEALADLCHALLNANEFLFVE